MAGTSIRTRWREEEPDPELVSVRHPLAVRDELLEERAGGREQEAGPVAGVVHRPASVHDAGQAFEGEVEQLPGGTPRVGQGADSATASAWVLENGPCAQFRGSFSHSLAPS